MATTTAKMNLLETPRLILEPFDPAKNSHYDDILMLYSTHDIGSMRMTTRSDVETRAATALLHADLCSKARPPSYPWILFYRKDTGICVGQVSVFIRAPYTDSDNVAVGYKVHPEHRKMGFATEALTAALRWADEGLGIDKVAAGITTDNIASKRVAEKAGGKIRPNIFAVLGDDSPDWVEYEWVFKATNRP